MSINGTFALFLHMPSIPPIRQKRLKTPRQDNIQWELTNNNEKSYLITRHSLHKERDLTTRNVAERFIHLLNTHSRNEGKIREIANDIELLHNAVAFSSRRFIEYVVAETEDRALLMEYYYLLSLQLNVLAVTTRSLLDYLPQIDEVLCELLTSKEDIAQAYIAALDENTMKEIFIKDGTQFVKSSALMKKENVLRLLYILKYYANTMNKEHCVSQLLQLNASPATTHLNVHYYQQLKRTKETILSPNKVSSRQKDTFLAKSPVWLYLSTWFFEFNEQNPAFNLADYALKIYYLNFSEPTPNLPDISLLLHIYHTGCRQLLVDQRDVIRINDIVQTLKDAILKSLEQDDPGGIAIILTLAQITFENLQESVGYTYVGWFENTFTKESLAILNKRSSVVFMNVLQQLVPYELPSILQIHGKVLQHCMTIPNTNIYISTVKKTLLELGVDATFKNYPQSMQQPIQSVLVVLDDEISGVIEHFIREGSVPISLKEASIFRKRWFVSTFIPKLKLYEGNTKARDELIEFLKKERLLTDGVQVQKKKK